MTTHLPYRRNVGAALFNHEGRVLVGRRADQPHDGPHGGSWQMPQGGIDKHEAPEVAVLRELREEIGTDRARILGRHPDLLAYDFPPELLGDPRRGRFRGQEQCWFALLFEGTDADIRLDAHEVEFDAWRWAELAELPDLIVPFKRPIYAIIARDFSQYADMARSASHANRHKE